jgi:Tol biopolymer transport system component
MKRHVPLLVRARALRKLIAFGFLAAAIAAIVAVAAAANPRGSNGRIVFARFDPALGDDFIYTANPDGSHEQQLLSTGAEGPRWSPDGTRIVVGPHDADNVSARIVNPDDGSYRDVANPDPDRFFLPCNGPWSPDGQRLTCAAFSDDESLTGIYTLRSSDGGGLTRITSDPGGEDCAGDYSPNGKRLVFLRANDTIFALFTIKLAGGALRQISPSGSSDFFINFECGNWSPQGNEILFSAHVPDTERSTIWTVHSDGTGLHKLPISGCGGSRFDLTTAGCFNARWSPDGTKIIFNRFQPQVGEDIYTANADGSNPSPAVASPLDDEDTDWGTHPLVR